MNRYPATRVPFSLRPIACGLILAFCEAASANPTGAKVTAGAASMQEVGKTLNVTNAPGTIINWQGFSIGSGEHTKFIQQSASSAVLNRVVGSDVSSILGALTSNGRVFLVNPNGILFGAGSRIDTAGFIASTLNIADKDFLAGKLKFEGGGNGVLRNEGAIRASGDIMLVGPTLENAGSIVSDHGSVLLAAGRKVTITSPDAQGVRFELQAPSDSAINVGSIDAASSAAMFAGTLRHSGDIRARGATLSEGGKVSLVAQTQAIVDKGSTITARGENGGNVTIQSGDLTLVSGHVDASGTEGKGGSVHILGHLVGLMENASVDASGQTGGGTILVGGDYQGRNADVQNAWRTYVAPDATLRADAIAAGDGGKVIVWADDINRYYGKISARGGAQSGDGGFVEVSGKRLLDYRGLADTRAPNGRGGTLLLDPSEINIVAADNVFTTNTPVAAGAFNGGANEQSEIPVNVLLDNLHDNANVSITTSAAAAGSGDINFLATVDYTTIDRTNAVLTLNAHGNVNFKAAFLDSGPAPDRMSINTVALGAVNIEAPIDLRGGSFIVGGSGIVNMISGAPSLLLVRPGEAAGAFSAGTLNVANVAASITASSTTLTLLNVGPGSLTISGPTSATALTVAAAGTLNTDSLSASGASVTGAVNVAGETNITSLGMSGNAAFNSGITSLNALTMSGGTLRTSGALTVINTLDWSGGTIAGPGMFTTNAGSMSDIGGPVVLRGKLWENFGTVNFTSSSGTPGSLQLGALGDLVPAGFTNQGIVNIGAFSAFDVITSGRAGTQFVNSATLNKGSASTNRISADFSNVGPTASVTIAAGGELQLTGDGSDSGAYSIGSGATLRLVSGERSFNGNISVVGDGTLRIGTNATLTVNTPFIQGPGGARWSIGGEVIAADSLTFERGFQWTDGTITGAGPLFTSAGSTTTIAGAVTLRDKQWQNSGRVDFNAGGSLTLDSTAPLPALTELLNTANGTIFFNSDSTAVVLGTGGPNKQFLNEGTVTASAPNEVVVTIPFVNSGTVRVEEGALRLRAGVGSDDGKYQVDSGTTLTFAGNRTLGIDSLIDGTGTLNVAAGTLNVNGDMTHTGAINVSGGTANFDTLNGIAPNGITVTAGTARFQVPVTDTGSLTINGGAAVFNDNTTVAGTFTMSAGELRGVGTVDLNAASTWSGGEMFGAGTTRFNTGVTISGAAVKTLDGERTLHIPNGSTATWTGGNIAIGGAATILNEGTWADQTSNASIVNAGGPALFDNRGAYVKSVSTGVTSVGSGVTFDNDSAGASVQISSGTLRLAGGGTHSGSFSVDASATLELAGDTHHFDTGVSVTGPGLLHVSGGTLEVSTALTPGGDFRFSGGTVDAADTLTLNRAFAWAAPGFMTGSGLLVTSATSSTNVSSTMTLSSKVWNNAGSMSITGDAAIVLAGPAAAPTALNNSGTLTITSGSPIPITFTSTAVNKSFTNSNIVDYNGSLTSVAQIDVPTTNTGRINVNGGRLTFARFGTNDGTVNVADTAVFATGGNPLLNTATHVIGGAGTIDLGGATLTNAGTVRPGSADAGVVGTLAVVGNYVQTGTGTLEIDIGGIGNGTPDLLSVTGTAALAGTLDVRHAGTFTPNSDTSFTVLTSLARSGDFGTKLFRPGYDEFYRTPLHPTDYRLTLDDIINRFGGAVDNSWQTAGNWSLGHVATAGEDAVINNVGAPGPSAAYAVIISSGEQNARKLTAFENVTVSGGQLVLGPLESNVNAELLVTGGGKLELNGIINANSLRLSGLAATIDAKSGTLPQLTLENGTLRRSGGGNITITGPFNVSGGRIESGSGGAADLLVTSGVTTVTGTVNPLRRWRNTSTGTIELNAGAISPSSGGAFVFTNETGGTVNIRTGAANPFGDTGDALIANAGTINKFSTADQNFANAFTNSGTLDVFAGTLTLPSTPTQSGTITIREGAAVSTGNNDLTNVLGGRITGSGRLILGDNTLTNNGTLDPGVGTAPGTLRIVGNLAQGLTGQVNIALAGPDSFDVLAVTGNSTLGGVLNISTTGGYTATDGDAFTVFTGARTGTFAPIAPILLKPIVSAYGPRSLSLSVNSPPLNFWESDTSGSWNDATRWSLAHVPLAIEQVRIIKPGAITVTVPAGVFAADRLRSDEDLVVAGSLALTNRSVVNAALTVNGGTLLGTAPLIVNGPLTLNGATLAGIGGVTVNGVTGTATGATQLLGTLTTTGLSMLGGSLTVASTGELDLTGSLDKDISAATLTNNGTVNVSGSSAVTLRNGALWDNFGVTNLRGSSRLVLGGGAGATRLVNRGTGAINDASSAGTFIGANGTNGSFNNAGTFTKGAGSAATQFIDAAMTNTGTIEVNNGTLVATSFPVNSGTIAVSGGATFSTSDAALMNSALGLLTGNGTFDVGDDTLTNSGTIRPGSSPGALTIDGNFAQTSTGTLEIEVGGTRAGIDYDLLKITGNASLGGTLAIKVPVGTVIAADSDFDFMTYAGVTNDFAVKTVVPGFAFVGIPGPTSYGISPPAPINVLPDPVRTVTTRDALVFSDQLTNPQTQQANIVSNQSAETERKREALPECR